MNKLLSVLFAVFFTLAIAGCGDNSSGSGTKTYTKNNIPEKFMADVPKSLIKVNSTTPRNKSASKASSSATSKEFSESREDIDEIISSSVCDPMGYDYLREIITEIEAFKSHADYEFMIMDSFFEGAVAYLAENENPVPAGTLETEFTPEMKTKLIAGFSAATYGDSFVNFLSTALDRYVGEKILNPLMTVEQDPSDTDGDGYNYSITYNWLSGPDISEIFEDALDMLEGDFEASVPEEEDPSDENDESEDGDDDETTIVRWSTDKTKISITKKEEETETFDLIENGVEVEKTGKEISTEICTYDSTTGVMTFTETEKDPYVESRYTISIEEKAGSDMVKIKSTGITEYLLEDFESIMELEAIADDNGGYLVESFSFTDQGNPGTMVKSAYKETFHKDGNITGVYYREDGSTVWVQGECQEQYDYNDSFGDLYESEWDSDEWDNDDTCVIIKNIAETNAGLVLVPKNVVAPGIVAGGQSFNSCLFFTTH